MFDEKMACNHQARPIISGKNFMNAKSLIGVVLFLAAASAAGWYHSRANTPEAFNKKPPAYVTVAPVAQKTVPLEFNAVGSVVPYQSVAVHARLDTQITDVKF